MKKLFPLLAAAVLFVARASAQRPTHVPGNGEPLRLLESPENVIFFLVVPVVIGVLYFIWRRKQRREQDAGPSAPNRQTKDNQ